MTAQRGAGAATVRVMRGWLVEHSVGSADDFHHRDISQIDRPTIWVHRVERPALVLGSSQRDELVDLEAAARLGVEVCRRRSGGGLVLVDPAASCWIDVLVTPDSALWDDDVNRSFLWVGRVWADALADLGVDALAVHDGPPVNRDAGRFLCFTGVGSGEVIRRAAPDRWKLVGLSQRRQRTVARIQGLFVSSTDLDLTRSLIVADAWPTEIDPDDLRIGLGPAPPRVDERVMPDELPARFVERLPSP